MGEYSKAQIKRDIAIAETVTEIAKAIKEARERGVIRRWNY